MTRRKRPAPRVRGIRRPEELPSGKWRAWTWDAKNKRKGPSRSFDENAQAMAWMVHEQAVLDGLVPPEQSLVTTSTASAPDSEGVWFADYVTRWAAAAGGTVNTRECRQMHARALVKVWPRHLVADIKKIDVRRLLAAMEAQGYSSSTRSGRLGTLRGCMAEAIEEGLRLDDPTHSVSTGRWVAHRETRVPTDDEVERIMAELPPYARPGVLLSRDSGLRLGEVAALRWRHQDLEGAYNDDQVPSVLVGPILLRNGDEQPHPKGKKALWVPLSARTVKALREHHKRYPGGPDDYLFREQVDTPNPRKRAGRFARRTSSYGGSAPIGLSRWDYLWTQARDAAGLQLPLPRWHDLRHGLGHDLHAADAPAQIIQAVLRHADLTTSRRYMPDVGLQQAAKWTKRVAAARSAQRPGRRVTAKVDQPAS